MKSLLALLRRRYHRAIGKTIVRFSKPTGEGYPNFADGASKSSVAIARRLCEKLGWRPIVERMEGQKAGRLFERWTCWFVKKAFESLYHLRPGEWKYLLDQTEIYRFVQYRHMRQLETILQTYPQLTSVLGPDYLVKPDLVVIRSPVPDAAINEKQNVVDQSETSIARLSPLRASNHKSTPPAWFLHASISCKWTIRSDRSQNIRTEALNLIRNRKGPLPHVMAVTAEPLPTRIASLALGTGELDCTYHVCLHELEETCRDLGLEDQVDMLQVMIEGNRLRDISDLPLDLIV